MKISLDWLREYIRVPFTPEELDSRLTMLGIEVEAIENFAKRYDKIVVGEVLEVAKHPNADKLHTTRVSIGEGGPLKIVCGAPNVRVGLKVAVAQVGADLGEGFVIKKSKIRGEVSEGMLCSERELGLSESHAGLLELPSEYQVGKPLAEALGKNDVVLEIGITPNRPDCLSHIGIAREVAAITDEDVRLPKIIETKSIAAGKARVTISDPDLCPRYAGRLVTNVTVKPSPDWLRGRLEAVGLRPINNIVDVTNYVLMECGHPLHAFDFSFIKNDHIIVRRAKDFATEFITLDGKTRKLEPDTLLISDSEKPLAIAGIMGGKNSEISNSTKDVFIESAYFLPKSIRKSGKQLGLSTDASYRFERGTDIENVIYALDRATALIAELGEGEIVGDRIDVYPTKHPPKQFTFRPARAEALVGMKIERGRMLEVFAALNILVKESSDTVWMLTSPTYRIDLEREEDATEELVRVIGYEQIPSATFEKSPLPTIREPLSHRVLEAEVRSHLLALGVTECVSSPLISTKEAALFHDTAVEVINPLNEETDRMRTSIAVNLLEIARRNERFGAEGQRLFELGNVFAYGTEKEIIGKIRERTELGLLITGVQESKSPYNASPQKADIFYIRGIAEQLLNRLNVGPVESVLLSDVPSTNDWPKLADTFEPSASVGLMTEGKLLAVAGKVSTGILKVFDLRGDAYLALFDYSSILKLLRVRRSSMHPVTPLPKYPGVERDLALVLSLEVTAKALLDTFKETVDKSIFQEARIFDEFRSPEMKQAGERSLGVRLALRAADRTLEDSEVDLIIIKVLKIVEERYKARLRS